MTALFDTNQLMRMNEPSDADYRLVRRAAHRLRLRGVRLCIFSQNLIEFWNVATRPATTRGGFGLSLTETDRRMRLLERRFELLPDTPAVFVEWRRLVVAHSVSGVQVHDARLAAAMRVHGIGTIITFDTVDFARFPGIAAVHPKDV